MQDIATQLEALDDMTTGELADLYRDLHGQPCRTRHRAYLIRKNAWRIQANAEGDLSERAHRRALELADDADVRVMAPKTMICPPQTGKTATVTRPVPRGPAKLDSDDHDLLLSIAEHGLKETARMRGVSWRQVTNARDRLRKEFEKAGLGRD